MGAATEKVSLVKAYGVAVYALDRVYGGPEEGDWWYNTGQLVHRETGFCDKEAAFRRLNELENGEFKTTGDLYSINYRGGAYEVRVVFPGDDVPEFFPERTPVYE